MTVSIVIGLKQVSIVRKAYMAKKTGSR